MARRTRNTKSVTNPTAQLELFLFRIQQLSETRLAHNKLEIKLSLRGEQGKGMRVTWDFPDEDDLRSFLLTFRQFIMNDEPVFLNSIFRRCYQHVVNDELVGYLVDAHEKWQRIFKQNLIRLTINEREHTPEVLLDLWINGWYFHTDPDKLNTIRQFMPFDQKVVSFFFLSALVEATNILFYVGNLVRYAVENGLVSDDVVRTGRLRRR